ncbi:MAG: V-type ATP synthase subunit F [Spirochaetales bacterium]|nr:V-type ATP synthase subunit F [Spirochaetales bacterium]
MNYYIIGDEDAVLGFRLVGVRGAAVTNREQAERAFHAALENEQNGILIITERVAELIRPLVDRFLFREKFPLIVEVQDRLGPLEGKKDLRGMVNEAIGIKL